MGRRDAMSDDEEPQPGGLLHGLRERTGVIVASAGLVAWCAMLWFMFGDVL